jgi:phytoene dehydrogenase-like protein
MSPWEVIRHEFADPHVQAFMLWMAFQTNQAVDMPGSGVLAYSLVFGRQQRSWSILPGGSQTLVNALVRYLEDHGSTIVTGKTVTRLILDGDRCAGVEAVDTMGVRHEYRAARAVLSTIHVTHLRDMASATRWPEEFHYSVDTYDVGIPGFGVYLATSAPPVFETPGNATQTAVSAGTVGWPEDVIRLGADLRAGRFIDGVPWLLIATPTLADPTRAPAGHHTVKLLSQNVYDVQDWDAIKEEHAKRQLARLREAAPNFTADVIEAMLVKSPKDYEKLNPHMVHGAFHGGDRGIAQSGGLRPAPGWGSHRMPIAGLYQTGATTHPGGSITGAPGRNAAMVLLHDLGHDPAEILSPS